MNIKLLNDELPVRSEWISFTEFVDLTGAHPTRVGELIELGWIEPKVTSREEYLFRAIDIYRLRKLERICRDFELSIVGGSIIVDLLGRIEALERKLQEMERLVK